MEYDGTKYLAYKCYFRVKSYERQNVISRHNDEQGQIPFLYDTSTWETYTNASLTWQNGRHFADDVFRCIFVAEKFCILIKISLKCVPKSPIDHNPALLR